MKKTSTIPLFSLILTLCAYSPLFSQDKAENQFDCYDGSQTEMTFCSLKEFRHYDSILNVRYSELMRHINTRLKEESEFDDSFELEETKAYKSKIIESQRSWIKMRDKNEEVYGLLYKGGSMAAMAMNLQLKVDTQNRIQFLEALIQIAEN